MAQALPDGLVIEGNVHGRATVGSTMRGEIEVYKGLNLNNVYSERISTSIGLGATVGYLLMPNLGLHLGVDVTRPQGEREGVRFRPTLIQTTTSVRLSPSPAGRATIPYFGLGLSSLSLREPHSQYALWPYPTGLSGYEMAITGGLQRRIGSRVALDLAVQIAHGRFDAAEREGFIPKPTNAGITTSPRIDIGLSWLPPANNPQRIIRDAADFDVGRTLRLHGDGDDPFVGSVVEARRDSVLLQLRRDGNYRQITIPYACIRRVDVSIGERRITRVVFTSAVQGLVTGSGILLALRLHKHPGVPIEPGRFVLTNVLPSVTVGALLGLFRPTKEWANAPLPAQVTQAVHTSGPQSCGRSGQQRSADSSPGGTVQPTTA
jgi:hypothetical protein